MGSETYSTTQLLEQVAVSQYALHTGVHLQHIKLVWKDLWEHVAMQLRAGKVRFANSIVLSTTVIEVSYKFWSRASCCQPWEAWYYIMLEPLLSSICYQSCT